MRDYGKVYTAFWTSEDVLAMTEDERTLALYLLTCPHGNMLGCFRLPNAYASDDLKWDMERVSKGFSGLVAKGYLYRCERSFWLVIRRYLKWNQFENPNVGKAAGKLFDTLGAPTSVKACLAAALRDFAPTFPVKILDKFEAENEPFRNPFELSPETGAVAVAVARAGTGAGAAAEAEAAPENPGAAPPPKPQPDMDGRPTVAAPLPMREEPPMSEDPAVQLTIRLRRLGVGALFTHPDIQDWTARQVPFDVLEQAVVVARERKGDQTIPTGYLRPIVDQLLNPPAAQVRAPVPTGVQRLGKAGQATAQAAEQWLSEQEHG